MSIVSIVIIELVWALLYVIFYINFEAGSSVIIFFSRSLTFDFFTDFSVGTEERFKGGRAYEKWIDGE